MINRPVPWKLLPIDAEVLKQGAGLAEHFQIQTRTVVRLGIPVEDAIMLISG